MYAEREREREREKAAYRAREIGFNIIQVVLREGGEEDFCKKGGGGTKGSRKGRGN